MPWHQSKSDPRKVYDSYHNTVCVAQTADQAAVIVKGVNALGPQSDAIKLREPLAAHPVQIVGETPAAPLDTFEQDNCCGVHLAKAGRGGVLAAVTSWHCPMCQTEWMPRVSGPIRHWAPVATVMIFR